jgi:adenine-specific DNA-methyltransferase
MATKKTTAAPAKFVGVDALKHADDKRRNIPTAEYQSLLADEAKAPCR